MSDGIKRKRMIERIKAMKSRTTAAGATEAEADTAAKMAESLMAEYRIDQTDIEAIQYDRVLLKIRGVKLDVRKSHPFVFVVGGVQHLTGVMTYATNSGLYVVGDEVGREIASYLYELTHDGLNREWAKERKRRIAKGDQMWNEAIGGDRPDLATGIPKHMRNSKDVKTLLRDCGAAVDAKARRSFMVGMAHRMGERMKAMDPARPVPSDTAERIMSDKPQAESKKRRKPNYDATAIASGAKAGETAPISWGIGKSQAETLKISGE